MSTQFDPISDVKIPCMVRIWQDWLDGSKSGSVFVHPREWALIALRNGTPAQVHLNGYIFESRIDCCGEHYRMGRVSDEDREALNLPPADYPAEAAIVWEKAIPEIVLAALREDAQLLAYWRKLPVAIMLDRINRVRRVTKPSSGVNRQIQLINELKQRLALVSGDPEAEL